MNGEPPVRFSAEQVLRALMEDRDTDLIGLEESSTFDAKSEPYRLDDPRSRWELAKDVSAMANADGGLILVGARTERLEGSFVERVASIRPVPATFLNEEQLRSALARLLFPSIGTYVELHRFDREGSSALLAILVRRPPDDDQPVLVATRATVDVDGRTHEIEAWALARRVGSGTEWDQGAKVWSDIRDGRLARRNLMASPASRPSSSNDRLQERLDELLGYVGASEHAYWVLAAYPTASVRIQNFASDDGVFGLIRSLPQDAVRPNGFGLGYGLNVQALGDGLADIEAGRRALLVEPDGLIVAIALGTREMLGWAHESWSGDLAEPLRINRFIVAEWPLEFTRFAKRVRALASNASWEYVSRVRGLRSGRPPQQLHLSGEWYLDSSDPRVDDAETSGRLLDPELDAHAIVAWFVGLFGRAVGEVPAVGGDRISADLIRTWR